MHLPRFTEAEFRKFLTSFRPPAPPGSTRVPVMIVPEFVHEYGRYFDERVALPTDRVFPESQACYWNAWLHRAYDPSLRYCEGYVQLSRAPYPVLHGWLLDAQGQIHDPSVANEDSAQYFGVVFKKRAAGALWRKLLKIEACGIIENLWLLKLPGDYFDPAIAAIERKVRKSA